MFKRNCTEIKINALPFKMLHFPNITCLLTYQRTEKCKNKKTSTFIQDKNNPKHQTFGMKMHTALTMDCVAI